jgi:hypothetical protein
MIEANVTGGIRRLLRQARYQGKRCAARCEEPPDGLDQLGERGNLPLNLCTVNTNFRICGNYIKQPSAKPNRKAL